MNKTIAAFGSWQSPIGAAQVAEASISLAEPRFDGADLYWLESRPAEKGRGVIVRQSADGTQRDVLPAPLSARSRVNEYGGGSYCVHQGIIYFVLFDDQRIYRLDTRQSRPAPLALTAEGPWRFGDLQIDARHQRLLAVCEDHSGGDESATYLVALDLNSDAAIPGKLLGGHDFFAAPRVSPDGKQLAWIAWDHPRMPWESSECYVGEIADDGAIVNLAKVAGDGDESVVQPQWSPDNRLFLISDRNNWWNIYRADATGLTAITHLDAEFCGPPWVFGLSSYAFLDANTLLAAYSRDGLWRLATVDITRGDVTDIDTAFSDFSHLNAHDGTAVFIAASSRQFAAIYRHRDAITAVPHAAAAAPPPAEIAEAKSIRFSVNDTLAHAFFYPPNNSRFAGPHGERPPLLVLCHGGPTSATSASLNFKIQFWTSRGFAVADVNYAGSTGFGRRYRERLNGQWGIADVADAVACVDHLASQGLIDPERVAIRGSSAGGYSVLAALTFTDTFKAGASLYGIGDLETLARDTHKFESRYLDSLVGAYPEQRDLYRARSPLHHAERLQCPVIFFQGLKDNVVPPNQAETMVAALKAKGIPVAYVTYADEGHGFRQAANIRHALEAELYFYSQVFGFTPADPLPAIDISNFPRGTY